MEPKPKYFLRLSHLYVKVSFYYNYLPNHKNNKLVHNSHLFYALYALSAGIVCKRFARRKKWHKLLFSILKTNKVRACQLILYINHFIHESFL